MNDSMRVRFAGLMDLARRYRVVFATAWAERHKMAPSIRRPEEAEFLPAALALQETPVSPAPRMIIWLLIGFAGLATVWACFGEVDIVASAQGKIIDGDRSKVIQPTETAAVQKIHVRDGQAVRAGDLLIELDATGATADSERLRRDLAAARLQSARGRLILSALDTGRIGSLEADGIDVSLIREEQALAEGQLGEYRAKQAQLSSEEAQKEAELGSVREAIAKLERTVPLARQKADDYKNLVDKNFVSKHGYLDKEQYRIEQEADLAAQRSRAKEIAASVQQVRNQKTTLQAETRRSALDSVHEADQKAVSIEQELKKAEARGRLLSLTSPVDGTVQQLAIHTVGGVVTPAQALMVIVPQSRQLEAEVFLENKDVGFVSNSQDVEVKIETFPYTKYGTVPASILSVSNDAIQDEKKGLVFSARVRLSKSEIMADGKPVNLSPGMAIVAEIKTGKRRVIDYFLNPLLQYKQESLRER